MISNDCEEMERVDARNALEEYVYDMRDKLQEDSPLAGYVSEADRLKICSELNDLENWLYEEGEDCEKTLYRSKLTGLQDKTNPIKARCNEYENQTQAFNELGLAIQLARKSVDEFHNGEPKYSHLTEAEMLNIGEAADKAHKWLDQSRDKLVKVSKTVDPPIKLTDIHHEYQTLTTCVNSVLNRPKPKPPADPKPTATPTTNNEKTDDKQTDSSATTDNNTEKPPQQENEMDIDN